jgi:hypothetical protein
MTSLPLSGSEPTFSDRKWSTPKGVGAIIATPMLWGIMKHIGGKSLFQVIGQDFLIKVTTTPHVRVCQTALFLITRKRFIKPEQMKSVKRGITKL